MVNHMKERIENLIRESIEVKEKLLKTQTPVICQIVEEIIACIRNNGKILLFGNGGSAADCQHMAAELVVRFQGQRKSLPAIALSTDSSILTAIGNDYGFEYVFSRQLEALGNSHDLAIAISTSGNSKNVILAVQKAKEMGLKTISLSGCRGGKLSKLTDISLIVPSNNTARIQEAHILCLHAICEVVESQYLKK